MAEKMEETFHEMTLVNPNNSYVRIDLKWMGDGRTGDFNPENPNDVALLRFIVYYREMEHRGAWEQVSFATFRTNLPATTPRGILAQAIKRIYDEVAGEVVKGNSVKHICENLSRISPDWFKDTSIAEDYNRMCSETIADIAMTAGFMLAKKEIQIDDSREFVNQVVKWAEDFNLIYLNNEWEDVSYIEAVDEFSKGLLLERYGDHHTS